MHGTSRPKHQASCTHHTGENHAALLLVHLVVPGFCQGMAVVGQSTKRLACMQEFGGMLLLFGLSMQKLPSSLKRDLAKVSRAFSKARLVLEDFPCGGVLL